MSRPGPTLTARSGRALAIVLIALTGLGTTVLAPATAAAIPVATSRSKASSRLDAAVARVAAAAPLGAARALAEARVAGLATRGERLLVVVETAPRTGASTAARALARLNGVSVTRSSGGLHEVLAPPAALAAMGALDAVGRVRAPRAHRALSLGESAAWTGATTWQGAGRTGAGVTVAIIDMGFAGYATAWSLGRLPAVTTINHCSDFVGEKHGTGVAELVHQVAPGAALILVCIDTEVGLALAAQEAGTAGATVITHSVGWYNSSRGDGTGAAGSPDAIAAAAVASGILWVNAAGNDADGHWSGAYRDTNANAVHEWAPAGVEGNPVWIPYGGDLRVFLKWDDWPVSMTDFDLYLVRASTGATVAWSDGPQTGTQEPTEALAYENPGDGDYYRIKVERYSGPSAPRLDLFMFGTSGSPTYQVAAGSLPEPASSPLVEAAGAMCWNGSTIESYSSRGPTIAGLTKPDITGPDKASTYTYGTASGCSAGFAGTSAAAPVVAGAAALVRGANPTWGPDRVRDYLHAMAVDLGVAGKDDDHGYGRLTLAPAPTISVTDATTFTVGITGRASITSESSSATVTLLGALPAGLTFAAEGAGAWALTGTPAPGSGGEYPLTVAATTDGGLLATAPVGLTVTEVAAFISPDAATMSVGAASTVTIRTVGFPRPTIGLDTTPPTWLTLIAEPDGTAALTGTPPDDSAGTSLDLVLRATNGADQTTQTLTIAITPGTPVPRPAWGGESGGGSGGAAVMPTQQGQAIAFSLPASVARGTSLSLRAVATSGLTVAYVTTTPGTCSLAGSTLRFIAVGICAVRALQPGDGSWTAAVPVTRSLGVRLPGPRVTAGLGRGSVAGTATTLAVARGGAVTVRAIVAKTAATRTIRLWIRPLGGAWRSYATRTVGRDGIAAARIWVPASASYRWVLAGTTTTAAATSNTVAVTVR